MTCQHSWVWEAKHTREKSNVSLSRNRPHRSPPPLYQSKTASRGGARRRQSKPGLASRGQRTRVDLFILTTATWHFICQNVPTPLALGIAERIASPLRTDGVSDWCLNLSDGVIIHQLQHLGRNWNNLTVLMTFRPRAPILWKVTVFQQHLVSHSVTPAATRKSHYIRPLAADHWRPGLNVKLREATGVSRVPNEPESSETPNCQYSSHEQSWDVVRTTNLLWSSQRRIVVCLEALVLWKHHLVFVLCKTKSFPNYLKCFDSLLLVALKRE